MKWSNLTPLPSCVISSSWFFSYRKSHSRRWLANLVVYSRLFHLKKKESHGSSSSSHLAIKEFFCDFY
jgi:hypothetical protein